MKSKPPSRIRYEESHPVISVRLGEADYTALKGYLQKRGISVAALLKEVMGNSKQDNTVGVVKKNSPVPLPPQHRASPQIDSTPQESKRRMLQPVDPQDTVGEVPSKVIITMPTLLYYQTFNTDYLAMKARTVPPNQMLLEFPGGVAAFIEHCVVGYFREVLGKELGWSDS